MSLGKGIKLSTGFDLNAKSPLDNREWFKTIAERDALPDINLYEGLMCFVDETKHNYQYINGEWVDKDIGGGSGTIISDASDVLIKDEYDKFEATNVEDALNELSDKIDSNTGSSESIKEIEYGDTEPTDENISIWVDTSNDAGVMQSFADALLQEFRSTIADLYKEIADLKEQNKKLEARVIYLEMNGGGSGGDIPIEPDTNDIIMVDENNYVLTFEDGSIMCFDNVETETTTDIVITDEGGNILTFEDGSIMCFGVIETGTTTDTVITDENGNTLTFEDGSIMCFSIEEIEANATKLLTFEDDSIMTFEDGSLMCFNVEITNDIILINELEEILIDENNNILIE